MSNDGSHALPPNGDGDHEGSSPWLELMDTDAIEDNFTEHYGAEDVRDELRHIMERYNDALPGADVDGQERTWQSLAQDDDNSGNSLSDTTSVLTLNTSPASTNIAEQYENRNRDLGEPPRGNLDGLPPPSLNLQSIHSLPHLLVRSPLAGQLRGLVPELNAQPTGERTPRHVGLMGKLNKVRLLGELVEVVEAVQGEEDFCAQLSRRLMEFRRTGFRDIEPLLFGSEEQAELLGQPLDRYHFAEAIAYLDQNMRLDKDLYQLAEDSLKKFKTQRAVMYSRASAAQSKFYDLLDQLLEGENCSDMNMRVRSELHELSGAHKCLRRVTNQLIFHPLSEKTYSETMRMIKCLVAKLCVLMPFHIPCTLRWGLIRNEEVTCLTDSLTEDLSSLHLELNQQRKQVLLDRSMEQERASGHLLELHVGSSNASEEEIEEPQQAYDSGCSTDRDSDSSSTTDQRRSIDHRSVQQSLAETATRQQNFLECMKRYKQLGLHLFPFDVNCRSSEPGLPNDISESEDSSTSQSPEEYEDIGDMADWPTPSNHSGLFPIEDLEGPPSDDTERTVSFSDEVIYADPY
ncbi:uncharacterized protein [Drosophila pseudoobscura]|uniref:Uncharacterized protein n=1 Tax=Drosophila pseudoobscura pseudoobscura TaxID=46245 RepID=A0A6I8V003_DROPS|nr:uncharacterized protein LOC6901778 [Drosophila pseudoobscura]